MAKGAAPTVQPEIPAKPETPATPEAPAASETYVVQSGDCLRSIAANVLGNGTKWNESYKANQDVIKDPALVYAGQTLKLPQ